MGVNLSPPEVLLTGWNARCLSHGDLNADGLEDLVYFNLDKSYLEILYGCPPGKKPPRVRPIRRNRWEPVLEDAPYLSERIFVTGTVTDIAIGDLNQDSRLDLVTGSPDDGVRVYFREENSTWADSLLLELGELRPYSMSLKVVEDPSSETSVLYAFTKDGLERLSFLSGKPRYPSELSREDQKKAYGVELIDLDRDGLLDWIYLVSGDEYSLKLRKGRSSGFGPEESFKISLASFPTPIERNPHGNDRHFCSIDSISGEAVVFSLGTRSAKIDSLELDQVIKAYDLFPDSNKKANWAWGDFDGDGFLDVVANAGNKGELLFLQGSVTGDFSTPRVFPSLLGISNLSTNKIGRSRNLLIWSPEEEVVGISEFKKGQGFQFPKFLKITGDPKVSESFDCDADGTDEVLVVCERGSDFILESMRFSQDQAYESVGSYELKEAKDAPAELFACNLNGDQWMDLLVLYSRNAPTVLLGGAKLSWREAAGDSIIRKSFLNGVEKSKIGKVRVEDRDLILVAGSGYLRELRWGEDDFEIVRQVNAGAQTGDLLCPRSIQWLPGGESQWIAYHEDGYWELFAGEGAHSSEPLKLRANLMNPSYLHSGSKGGSDRILSFGGSGFEVIGKRGKQEIVMAENSRFLTDLPKVRYNGIEWGDFNGDEVPDLVCLDGKRNLLEFLAREGRSGEWKSELHFELFEKNLHYRGKKGGLFEPREGLVLDLNNDRLDDLVFLVHDRLLIYHQYSQD